MMNCGRCSGMMEHIYLFDCNNETGQPFIEAWQCLNCGEIVDGLILQNRVDRPEPFFQKARTKNRYGLVIGKNPV